MWRYLLILLGISFALVSTGISDKWFYDPYPEATLLVAVACCGIAVRGWKLDLALISLGLGLTVGGATLFWLMPQVVNRGSGQDAVALYATVVGAGAGLVGLILTALGVGIRLTASQKTTRN